MFDDTRISCPEGNDLRAKYLGEVRTWERTINEDYRKLHGGGSISVDNERYG
jgi:hypothetical protein